MFDLVSLIKFEILAIEAKAQSEGRNATAEEHRAGIERVWNAWMEASVTRDMTAAGFVKTETGWERPRTFRNGIWAWLFGD